MALTYHYSWSAVFWFPWEFRRICNVRWRYVTIFLSYTLHLVQRLGNEHFRCCDNCCLMMVSIATSLCLNGNGWIKMKWIKLPNILYWYEIRATGHAKLFIRHTREWALTNIAVNTRCSLQWVWWQEIHHLTSHRWMLAYIVTVINHVNWGCNTPQVITDFIALINSGDNRYVSHHNSPCLVFW